MNKEVKDLKEFAKAINEIWFERKAPTKEDYQKQIEDSHKIDEEIDKRGYTWETHRYFHTVLRAYRFMKDDTIVIDSVTFDVERTVKLLKDLKVKKVKLANNSTEALEYVYELSKYYDIVDRYITEYDRCGIVFQLR